MALGCESLRTAMLKIKHVAVMMEVGAQGRIGKKIWFNCLDCFFPSPFKQTPDGHPAGMTISLLRFWQPLSPCSFPSLSTKKEVKGKKNEEFTIIIPTLGVLNLQTSDSAENEHVLLGVHKTMLRNPGNHWHSGISVCGVITLTDGQE